MDKLCPHYRENHRNQNFIKFSHILNHPALSKAVSVSTQWHEANLAGSLASSYTRAPDLNNTNLSCFTASTGQLAGKFLWMFVEEVNYTNPGNLGSVFDFKFITTPEEKPCQATLTCYYLNQEWAYLELQCLYSRYMKVVIIFQNSVVNSRVLQTLMLAL